MLIAVNSYINDLIEPKTDRDLYGVEELDAAARRRGL